MRAAIYEAFQGPVEVRRCDDPAPTPDGVVLRVRATGICRSDWHGWMGHDPDISVPQVPGHEIAGEIAEVGSEVASWHVGDRVTLPFVCGCGNCGQCASGNEQVCDRQFQPGFTHWGSYAEYVSIHYAERNLVALPDDMDFVTAASLGCRFATAYRGIVAQGRLQQGEWLAVHGCGGVGLAAVMIGQALGGRVVAVDIDDAALGLASAMGAEVTLNARQEPSVVDAIRAASSGGVQVSVDALGSRETCTNSIRSLAKRGRHVQIGLLAGEHRHPPLPMELVIANELEIVGSHGMQAHAYGEMLQMIDDGRLAPRKLVGSTTDLESAARQFVVDYQPAAPGVSVIVF
ncbi:MAG: zinc-dependent alcohol dehydrogenase family protein [Gammaproteobacteria bacterium]|nr:zinc-dependent alcohol dehydrogenase family protein [Gammaproteobacteria bacterium]